MIDVPPSATSRSKLPRSALIKIDSSLSETELRALQELADIHGNRWRTVLLTAHGKGSLKGTLKDLMKRPEAGNEIARVAIVPRSLPPTALYYGPIYFS